MASQNVKVVKRNQLLSTLIKDMNSRSAALTDEHITKIFTTLQKHTLANEEIKQQHITSIKSRLGS